MSANVETPDPNRHFVPSTRPRIGLPDYRLHPEFIRTGLLILSAAASGLTQLPIAGIPGLYSHAPVDPSKAAPACYYVIIKGVYVGIFHNW